MSSHATWLFALQPMLDGLADAAVVVDENLHPMAWNEAYLRAVGGKARTLGKRLTQPDIHCHDLYRMEVCQNDCLAKRVFAHRDSVRMDELRGKGSGDPQAESDTLIVTAVPLVQGEGVRAVLEIYRNVTAEERVHQRYKDLLERERYRADDLADQVKQRTADLQASLDTLQKTKEQLVQSEKLKSLGSLVAGVAHELNNPINFIGGNIEFLREHLLKLNDLIKQYDDLQLTPAQQAVINASKDAIDYTYIMQDLPKLMASIANGSERAATIVKGLRTSAHRGTEQHASMDVVDCLEQTLSLWNHKLRGRIVLERNYAPELPAVRGNPGQLGQVFMNLLSNAVQAVGDKGRIGLRVQPDAGGVAIAVQDSGHGIPAEMMGRVFDPFFTTKPPGEGTGLGLSICYSIIQAHHGHINVHSVPNEGATFTVWLPRAEAGAEAEAEQGAPHGP